MHVIEHDSANVLMHVIKHDSVKQRQHWQVNVDATFLDNSNPAWAGLVASSHLGEVVISVAMQRHDCVDTNEAEGKACGARLELIKNTRHVVLKSDNTNVVETIKNSTMYRGRLWRIFKDSLLWKCF